MCGHIPRSNRHYLCSCHRLECTAWLAAVSVLAISVVRLLQSAFTDRNASLPHTPHHRQAPWNQQWQNSSALPVIGRDNGITSTKTLISLQNQKAAGSHHMLPDQRKSLRPNAKVHTPTPWCDIHFQLKMLFYGLQKFRKFLQVQCYPPAPGHFWETQN